MTRQVESVSSSATKWVVCAHRYRTTLLVVVWAVVAMLVVPMTQVFYGAELARQVLVAGLAVLLSALAGMWITARLAPVSARGALVAGAPLMAGIALRLVVLMVSLVVLMFGLKWDQEAVGFGAIAWYLPLLAIEGWLVSIPSHVLDAAAVCQESPS